MDNEETPATDYRPYRPQDFDAPGDLAGTPGAPGTEPAPPRGEFDQAFTAEQAHTAVFDDRPPDAGEGETDFASLKFQRENTLLTNAESYAASIREEAQLYVRQLRSEVEALNREAEQRYAETERIKAEAKIEVERIKAEGIAGLDAVREQARAEGFEAGREDGMKLGREAATPQLEQLEKVLTEISQFRRRVAFYTEKDGVRLAMLMARRILNAELKINKQAVAKLVAGTLAKMQGKGTFRVWVSPADLDFIVSARSALERYLDEDQALTLRAKPDLAPGNVQIETDREVIDLTFQSQFFHLEQQLNRAVDEREAQRLSPRGAAAKAAAAKAGRAAQSRPQSAAGPEAPGHGD